MSVAFWTAALTSAITLLAFGIAIATPSKSGPLCVGNCVGYPYTDIAAYISRDFLWLYPALAVAPLFVVLTALMHERAHADRKVFSGIGIAFAVMAATLLTANYFIQLRVVPPPVLKNELDGLAPLSQYNPYGVFIALEEAGYVLMAVAFLLSGVAVAGRVVNPRRPLTSRAAGRRTRER